MNTRTKKQNESLVKFWDHLFKDLQPTPLDLTDIKVEHSLDAYLKELGDQCENVLDIGTGSGYCLFKTKILGSKFKQGLGIDPSKNAINYLRKTCEISNINDLKFIKGNHEILSSFKDDSFDGISCSNVLDVVPEKTSNEIINEIVRLLKPGGLLVLKLNFFLDKEMMEQIRMKEVAPHTFERDGVIRGLNFTTEDWIQKLNQLSLVKTGSFPRLKNGPEDRLLMFMKK